MLLPLVGCGEAKTQEAARPNVILIMADDLGYSDISCFGGTNAVTPNIDQLAADGLQLSDYHSNGAVSSPTRAALMTGKYQQRTGVTGVITAANHREVGLAIDEVTMADKLSELGYNCGMFGKWHLGYPEEFNPTYQGFDEFRGFVAGNIDYHSFVDQAGYYDLWRGNKLDRETKGYITDIISDGSVDFIKKNDPNKSGEPFFLYVPYPAPHYPYQSREDLPVREEGNLKYIRKVPKEQSQTLYRKIIEQTDEGIGRIVATVNELGIADNTIIIFCSDNGPNGNGNTGGFKGRKGSVYEGGHRVPGIIKYPAMIKGGEKSDVAMLGMDFFPTFVELAGAEMNIEKIDGVSFANFFKTGVEPAERNLFWAHGNNVAMRDAQGWKLVVKRDKENKLLKYELYDLNVDKFETTDLSEANAERVAKMAKAVEAWEADVYSCTKSMTL